MHERGVEDGCSRLELMRETGQAGQREGGRPGEMEGRMWLRNFSVRIKGYENGRLSG